MTLVDIFDKVRPSIVALATRWTQTPQGGRPIFPTLLGTGFVVDSRGIIATNRHVVEALEQLPRHPKGESSAIGIVWAEIERRSGMGVLPAFFADVKGYSTVTEFSSNSPYYAEAPPDIGFVQLKVRDLPALKLRTEANILRVGTPIATAGFPLGTDPLVAFGKVSQLTPFLRQGIISSVFPFPCPYPHGFTIDVMQQGGASGSPVFLADASVVVGMIHGGFPKSNLTFSIPSALLADALSHFLQEHELDTSDVRPLRDLLSDENIGPWGELGWESFEGPRSGS
jgi:S1-C subfamily serine protease